MLANPRPILRSLAAVLCLALAVACSRHAAPPSGRWEGTFDSANAIVVTRLEITPKGQIFISAPNAQDFGAVSDEDRAAIRQRLADGLEEDWGSAKSFDLDFDGKTFRRPGGIAPQLEWDSGARQMTMIVYLGTRPAIHIPLRAVKQFSPDPWNNA